MPEFLDMLYCSQCETYYLPKGSEWACGDIRCQRAYKRLELTGDQPFVYYDSNLTPRKPPVTGDIVSLEI